MVHFKPLSSRQKLCLAFMFNALVPYCLIHLYALSPDDAKYCPLICTLDSCKCVPTVVPQEVITVHDAAVATDDWRCSNIGSDFLRKGGNAVDAAVAAALCLGVVSPASSGLGGGAFMLLRLADGTTKAFDMREMAPMKASKDMYDGNATLKAKGALSIAVPGELAGLYEVWKQYGNFPWESLVMPAEDLAWGFEISEYLYNEMSLMESAIHADKGLSDVFTLNGKLLQAGDICQNIKLGETLRKIAKDGMNSFYNGQIGIDLTRDIQEHGGIMIMKDLQNYTVKIREPIVANILGMEILGMPPPSAGGAGTTLIFNILAEYVEPTANSVLWVHRMIETFKHFFAIRMNIGDPDFVDVSEVVSDMLSPEFAKQLKNTIDDNRTFDPSYYGGGWNELRDYLKHEYGTSHLSIVDDLGNAVALTTSVNYHFGSGILSPRTGILLNNQMDDFCMPPTINLRSTKHPENNNYIQGGKRPLSSMSPSIILKKGQLKAVIGASGGTLIIPGISEVIFNYFAERMDQFSSVIAPRVYHQLVPNVVNYENFTTVTGDHIELPDDIIIALEKKGHALMKIDSGAVCQFITLKDVSMYSKDKKVIVAVSDPRKGGVPAGY